MGNYILALNCGSSSLKFTLFTLFEANHLEHDIAGVVEAESGPKAPYEFYKSQAIISRTYLLEIINSGTKFDSLTQVLTPTSINSDIIKVNTYPIKSNIEDFGKVENVRFVKGFFICLLFKFSSSDSN